MILYRYIIITNSWNSNITAVKLLDLLFRLRNRILLMEMVGNGKSVFHLEIPPETVTAIQAKDPLEPMVVFP